MINSILRSTYHIADRRGDSTNWYPFKAKVLEILEDQHRCQHPFLKAHPDFRYCPDCGSESLGSSFRALLSSPISEDPYDKTHIRPRRNA